MTGAYPFGGLGYQPPPNLQILVRKVIVLAPETEHRIRLQLDIARRLPTDLVVKLLRVLEEPGKLHILSKRPGVELFLAFIFIVINLSFPTGIGPRTRSEANAFREFRGSLKIHPRTLVLSPSEFCARLPSQAARPFARCSAWWFGRRCDPGPGRRGERPLNCREGRAQRYGEACAGGGCPS